MIESEERQFPREALPGRPPRPLQIRFSLPHGVGRNASSAIPGTCRSLLRCSSMRTKSATISNCWNNLGRLSVCCLGPPQSDGTIKGAVANLVDLLTVWDHWCEERGHLRFKFPISTVAVLSVGPDPPGGNLFVALYQW